MRILNNLENPPAQKAGGFMEGVLKQECGHRPPFALGW